MTDLVGSTREQQRFEHLVLGRARPKAARSGKRRKPRRLAPGIEEQVALRERWSHKQGTPETLEHVDRARRRPGSLARLYESGAIDKDQLAAADQIREAFWAIAADVLVRTASFETRIDGGAHGRLEELRLGSVHRELAYDWWRGAAGGLVDALLAVIVHDLPLTLVARRERMSMPRARRMLTDALDRWMTARIVTRDRALRALG